MVNDQSTGLNAWQVRDNSVAQNAFITYFVNLTTNQQDSARRFGWVFSVQSRVAENLGTSAGIFACYEDYTLHRGGFSFNADANNNLVVGVTANGFSSFTLTSDGSGLNNYHLYQAAYDPSTALVSYYADGSLITTAPQSPTAGSVPEIVWGAIGSATKGTVNFNLVDFSTVDAPFVTIGTIGTNIQISYHGVLEATSQLAKPVTWTALATNITSSAGIYTIPSLSTQKFYRARLPE